MRLFKGLVLIVFALPFAAAGQAMKYNLDFTKSLDTTFVTLTLEGNLSKDHRTFQFPATAPGTYQTMNIGRFVSDFSVKDKKGKPLEVIYNAPNQFVIDKPHKAASISYKVAETFDTKVKEFPIYLMCGSSIEEDHALVNPHTMMGYFHGLQKVPFHISFTKDKTWKVGTALVESNSAYSATDFDHLVDSPILLGRLTEADTTIAETEIEIYTYSKNDKFSSDILLTNMSDMLGAANKFLVDLPVDRYTFLYHFEPGLQGQTGAWEHSYSSEYVLQENEPTEDYLAKVTDLASHEFFHIVTPLNIHSEVIESFNFVEPTPSVHLWLYEGVTEWASNILLYRGEVIDLDTYLQNAIAQKIYVDKNYFDRNWSLKKLAEESFTANGAKQYANIYYRGSLVAGLLDILLLDLSNGQSGLRELILDLIAKFGKGKPFSEENFAQVITDMTFPEVGSFVNDHIFDNKPLPHKNYLAKVGLSIIQANGEVEVRKMKRLTERQQMLFEAWSKNLPRD